ncbi:Rieske 2Fe-2S domain-containing protein [Devosia sp.]|uniref:Rieske 2Fe-2S domain-containing protein n=1 Tax=Devosia sp. TaxID=1871048 RepID=UPI003BA9C4E2
MTTELSSSAQSAWYPIASSEDLPYRHIFHGQLWGREFAVWRADDNHVNVWENRCLHRGVRLSIGLNEGAELKCQYHGWRYANRSAGCTYIPAHPADAPARRIVNRTYRAVEHLGLIWSSLDDDAAFAPPVDDGHWLALRPVPVNAQPGDTLAAVMTEGVAAELVAQLTAWVEFAGSRCLFVVQPVDAGRAVIRGLVPRPDDELQTLRHFNGILIRLRDSLELAAATEQAPAPIIPSYEPVSLDLATMPDLVIGRQATLRVMVKRKWPVATDVTALELAPLAGQLPTFQPGAHIDLHLSNGLIRQYSITNGPGEQQSYTIAAKREPESRGGSSAIAETVREGDVLAISEPRNNFPLRRDAVRTILVAGGIGLTPLLSMAKALQRSRLPFELHVFARSGSHLPFADELAALGASVVRHLGRTPAETEADIRALAGAFKFAHQLYVCGPAPMLELTRSVAKALGWPDEAIHFEYFANTHPIDQSSSFTVELARSALTLAVPVGKSILEVMRDNGLEAPSSCEQGACGTCMTRVLEGVPDHQDVYLNDTERAANAVMMTCVSRAKSSRLVLDI